MTAQPAMTTRIAGSESRTFLRMVLVLTGDGVN